MLVKVVARSRPDAQLVENTEGPNGFEEPKKLFGRCGIEPARKRDKTAVLGPAPEVTVLPLVSIPDRPGGRNGLVDGVGLEVGVFGRIEDVPVLEEHVLLHDQGVRDRVLDGAGHLG